MFVRVLMIGSLASLVLTAAIAFVLLSKSVRTLLGESPTPPVEFGALVGGTLLTTALALAVAVPCGLLSAIYLVEFASPRLVRLLRPSLDLLADVPTIAYGYFALVVVTPAIASVLPDVERFNALAPGFVLGIMLIPLVSSCSG